jgi:undecaprenyl-diphosphatase
MRNWDTSWFVWMAAGYQPNPTILAWASAAAVWGAWAGALLLCVAAWKYPSQRLYLLAAVVVGAFAGMLAHGLAASFNVPRPFMAGLSPAYIPHGGRGSFPSTHASVIFAIAVVLFLRPSLRYLAVILAMIGLVIGWGRVYTGIHFPLDILGGALLALAVGFAFVACAGALKALLENRKG